jgi:hypothetical protein
MNDEEKGHPSSAPSPGTLDGSAPACPPHVGDPADPGAEQKTDAFIRALCGTDAPTIPAPTEAETELAVLSVCDYLFAGGQPPSFSEWLSWTPWSRAVWIEAARQAYQLRGMALADGVLSVLGPVIQSESEDRTLDEKTQREAERLFEEHSKMEATS